MRNTKIRNYIIGRTIYNGLLLTCESGEDEKKVEMSSHVSSRTKQHEQRHGQTCLQNSTSYFYLACKLLLLQSLFLLSEVAVLQKLADEVITWWLITSEHCTQEMGRPFVIW